MAVSWMDPIGIFSILYQVVQVLISCVFSPTPPKIPNDEEPLGRVAIIGAGITGISSAAHLIAAGFEVAIFDENENIGGIWSRVNSTSGLQINSIMYRWFPAVKYTEGYPRRDEILDNVKKIWKRYHLERRTRFKTRITSIERHESSKDPLEGGHARWIINGQRGEIFDGIIVATGTCGKPKQLELPNQEKFMGKIVHSSHLDGVDLENKRVLIVGGGASGVEALQLAVKKGAKKPMILARSDKWFIPPNVFVDTILALNPLGRPTIFRYIVEPLLRKLHYRDLDAKMAPVGVPLYSSTPVVNSGSLDDIRAGRADYIRGDVKELQRDSVKFNKRTRGTKAGDKGQEVTYKADVIVVATGFDVPSLSFLPEDYLFPDDFSRPNLFLNVFSVNDVSVSLTNAAFVGALGTVGHFHIGVYSRILAMFLLDEKTRPHPRDTRLWVDGIRFIKENANGLNFFSYSELTAWLVMFCFFRRERIGYFFWVLAGYGYWAREGPKGQPKFHWSVNKLLPRGLQSKEAKRKSLNAKAPAAVNGAH